ncbi:helix-turn-helix domain-containing protein [Amycolatopsis speibonae]|uniref:Helix-turn-helix domain-containing protein n=1 Tax=Amycolatopsis speibonae TaxID=1450224 RepID=A0ABV7P4A6_9PSEU
MDPGDDPLLEFAADLRRLREKAGNPTYRELGRRAHYSAGTLSEAAGGKKMPSLAVTLAYVRACEGPEAEWEARWHDVTERTRTGVGDSPVAPLNGESAPYIGLTAFGADDASRFFGRERLVEKLVTRLSGQRFLAVLGASGSGKSSLLRAGLLPVAAEKSVTLLMTPGSRPLQECAVQFGAALGLAPGGLLAEFTEHPRNLGLAARQLVADREGDVVLVVDQFEEVFTLCQDVEERAAFLSALVTATAEPESRTRVVLGIRTDFYTHCARHPELVEAMQDAQILVGPMSTEELRQAISRPAIDAGYRVENALVSRLVADATGQPGVLPLLSHALLETWRRRHGNTLTLTGYESTGGIERSVAQSSEHTFTALSDHQQRLANQIFLRMTALGEGTEDTKRRIRRDEVDADDPDVAVVLDRLASSRLVTLDDNGIEIAHEALIRGWPRLREWLAEDREGLRVHRQLTEATEAWESVGRDDGWLYRGARLSIAVEWAGEHDSALSQRERRFLDASVAIENHEQAVARRRTRRLRQLVALLAVLLVLATAAMVYAVRAEQTATGQRNSALAQKVAGQAVAMRATNPGLAAQLALAAYRVDPGTQTRSSVLGMVASPYSTRVAGHANRVNSAALRGDGRVMVTGSWDQTAKLWDVKDPYRPTELATLSGHTENVNSVAFSADGGAVATAGWDKTARLWNVADPAKPGPGVVVGEHPSRVNAVAFSPKAPVLATSDGDGTIRLFDVRDLAKPTLVATLTGHTGNVNGLAYAPDGRTLASAGADKTARLWDVAEPLKARPLGVVAGHTAGVHAAAFSPDGKTLATASIDQTARLWDIADPMAPAPLATMPAHKTIVRSVAFSPDGTTLATTGFDRNARLWDITEPKKPREKLPLTGHTAAVVWAVFSPDGRTLVTASDDQTVRLWEVPGPVISGAARSACRAVFSSDGKLLATGSQDGVVRLNDARDPRNPRELGRITGFGNGVCGLAFSPDGRTLAAGSWDHTMRLIDVTDPGKPVDLGVFSRPPEEIDAVAFSPDGRTLATAGTGHTVKLWDVADPRKPVELATLTGHEDDVHSLAFAPDGRTLLTGGWDHTARLWDVSMAKTPKQLSVLKGHTDTVFSVAFSPDGKLAATGGADRTARIWDVSDPAAPRETALATGHTDIVISVAFSGDGKTFATGSYDRTVRLWDVADPGSVRESATLAEDVDRVNAVAFAPDGHTLAGSVADGSVRLWETSAERAAERVCATVYPRITAAEWEQHLPGLDYRPPCP